MPRSILFFVPPPPISPSPSLPPPYRRRARPLHRRLSSSTSSDLSSSSSSSQADGPLYVPSQFEVILPPSPASLPAAHLTAIPFEEVPQARVNRALDALQAVLGRAEHGISDVIAMREQQAGFLGYQERLLTQLREEQSAVEEELSRRMKELEDIEEDIATFSERVENTVLRPRINVNNEGYHESWSHTLHRTLRTIRTRSMT